MTDLAATYRQGVNPGPAFFEIAPPFLPMLSRMLQRARRADPFARSAAYYAMTGRKGLWLYGSDDTAMLVARHPNRDGRILFFPPTGTDPAGLMRKALRDPRLPVGTRELARLGPDDRLLAAAMKRAGVGSPHAETVLDWTFPVHIVSPDLIKRCEGRGFLSLRGHIHRAIRHGLTFEPVDVRRHQGALTSIVGRWADEKQNEDYTHDDLTGPTLAVIDLMKGTPLKINGVLTRSGAGEPIGFWLWEEVGDTAMSLVRVFLRQPGNAELGIRGMSEQLSAAGIAEMCLGGSETASLDAFKRKMQPLQLRSVNLVTLTLRANAPTVPRPRSRQAAL